MKIYITYYDINNNYYYKTIKAYKYAYIEKMLPRISVPFSNTV